MKLGLVSCIVFLFANTAYAIMCYECNPCSSPENLVNCSTNVTQCQKAVVAGGAVGRKCAGSGDPLGCGNITYDGHADTTYCICEGDSCNGDAIASTAGPANSTTPPMDGSTASAKNTSTNAPSSASSPPPSPATTTNSPATTKKDRQSGSFKCYECEDCATPASLVSCPNETTQCAKFTSGGLVSRSCGTSWMPDTCKSLKSKETCYCSADSCNGAGSLKGFTVLVTTIITAFLTKIFM